MKKILIPISATLIAPSLVLTIASCQEKPDDPVKDDPQQFIYDRTFSLMAADVVGDDDLQMRYYLGFGTGWIVEDATPSVADDYCYYVATNWHVTHLFDFIKDTKPVPPQWPDAKFIRMEYAYADKYSSDMPDIIDHEKYTVLKDNYFEQYDSTEHFVYDGKQGIDMAMCKINFADANQKTIEKLNRVNQYRAKHGYINNFVNADDSEILAKDKYIGGYPSRENEELELVGSGWESHKINHNDFNMIPGAEPSHHHAIWDDAEAYVDAAPQYCLRDKATPYDDGWMYEGSSGSMLITEDCEVCGIYWGGFRLIPGPQRKKNFLPSFSMFKTTDKDFIKPWLKK